MTSLRIFRLSTACLILCCLFPLRAETGILMPREVFVGDTAEFTFETGVFSSVIENNSETTIPVSDVESSPDVTVQSVLVRRINAGVSVTVRFVPWTPGLVQLPAFKLKKIRLVPPAVKISSLVEKTGQTALAPPRSPLLVPGTTWLLYALVAAFIAAFAVFAFTVVKLRKYIVLNPGKRLAGRRMRLLKKELRVLERRMEKLPMAEWFALYAVCLRRYLGSLCCGNSVLLLSATASESAAEIRRAFGSLARSPSAAELAELVHTVLAEVDTIRFSGRAFGDARAEYLSRAKELADLLEDAALDLARDKQQSGSGSATSDASDAASRPKADLTAHDREVPRVQL